MAAAAAGLALTIWLGRAKAVDRLFATTAADERRLQALPTIQEMIGTYMPWGTGAGTFDVVYRLHEPDWLLGPTYMNEAHNDWLDVALTSGVAGLVLLGLALGATGWRAWQVFRAPDRDGETLLARAALVCIMLLALASATDYPLRTPALAAYMAVLICWSRPGRWRV